ncbi:MAG: gliding motility-associated ABC transporter substrate-binding protein GldG [Chitinophagaceae bacterium]|nr:gliding motility-associated ABC transporter substrate-binding protein GldG [Chitinophagaceae bacterium]
MKKFVASRYWWLFLILILVVINFLGSTFHSRIDLTKEKRYTLSPATSELLNSLEEDVNIDIFLQGEFPAGFQKLANSTKDFVQLLKDRNSTKVHYRFLSPKDEIPGTGVKYGDSLVSLGATPINLTVQLKEGQQQNFIFPVALLHYKGKKQLVNLYGGSNRLISQNEINESEALLEYQFVSVLDKMINERRPGVAYTVGNGQPEDARTYDLVQTLKLDYDFGIFNLNTQPRVPDKADVLLIVKPALTFTEEEKLKIDQFVMRGGKLLCFVDNLFAEPDSLAFKPQTVAFDRNLNLTDMFFRYGTRINTDLVMDLQCETIQFVVGGGSNGQPQQEFLHWNYYPLFQPPSNHSINRNLGLVGGRFVNSMDTIDVPGVTKTVLLSSSSSSRVIHTPALISLNENRNAPEDEKFRQSAIPVAMLLEGKFTSLFRNRVSKAVIDSLALQKTPFLPASVDNKMIIVADGDIALNEVLPSMGPLPMGWNRVTYLAYEQQSDGGKYFIPVANRQFFQNCIEYLVANPVIIETRNKNIVLRLLDSAKVKEQRTTWQFINIALPVLMIVLFGFIYQQIRKRKYAP